MNETRSKVWEASIGWLGPSLEREDVAPITWLIKINLVQGWRRLASIGRQSKLLTTLIGGFVMGYLGLAYWLFYRGLEFAGRFPGLGALLVERLWYLLFAFLFILLLFSNLVISYTNLFKNRETAFLLTLPLRPQQVFLYKFIESVVLASWAFVFLVAPLVAAFGVTRGVPWHFYPMSVLMIAMLILLPGVAGAWLAIGLAQYLERRSFQILVLGGALVLLAAAYFYLKPEPLPQESTESRVLVVLDRMLSRTRFAELFFFAELLDCLGSAELGGWRLVGVVILQFGAVEPCFVLDDVDGVCGGGAFLQCSQCGAKPGKSFWAMGLVPGLDKAAVSVALEGRIFGGSFSSLPMDALRCAGHGGEGRANVLARHDAVGADHYVVWIIGGVCGEPAAFYQSIEQSFLGAFGFVFEFGSMCIELGDADNAFCVSPVFA